MELPRWDRPLPLLATTAAAAVAFAGSLAVMATIAGWGDVTSRLPPDGSPWLALAVASERLAFGGYVFAYRSVAAVSGGRKLTLGEATELVALGFGPFLAKGGAALDSKALTPRSSEDEGEIRVLALDALEHAPLAPAACAAAIALLVQGHHRPGLDFTIPWATLVPIGALLAWFGVRRRDRFTGRPGWRGKLGQILEGIAVLFRLAPRVAPSLAGVRGLRRLLGRRRDVPVGVAAPLRRVRVRGRGRARARGRLRAHSTDASARRRGDRRGSHAADARRGGRPVTGAILAVVVYRLCNLWLPLLPAAAALPLLRRRFGPAFRARLHET
jgi:hypothetical protein